MSGLAQFLCGQVLDGRYRLESLLGVGGFGAVFRATELGRGREVAVKVLDPPRGMDPDAVARLRERFGREAAMAAQLPLHPNLVRVLDFGSDPRSDFLVMELLHGESLRARLARPEPIALGAALGLLRDAARGVAVGHESGLVHRDLKPANLFLEDAGGAGPRVRVLDFGIAKVLDEADGEETRTHLTLPGEWFGSEFYSPPEHLRREGVSRASDVFSLGVVAFEVLTRTRLFTQEDQYRRREGLAVPIPSLLARNPEIPPEVERIVRRALAEDPAQRHPDAAALGAELHRVCSRLRGEGVAEGEPDAVGAAPEPVEAATVALGGAVPGDPAAAELAADGPSRRGAIAWLRRRDWPRMRRIAARAAAGVVLAAGGAAAMQATSGGGGEAARREAEPVRTAFEENREGLELFRNGRFDAAVDHFGRALAREPGHAEYMNNHAYALLRAGRVDEAVLALQEVVARHPEREVAYSNLVEAQLVQGDTSGAITTLQALLATDPSARRRREAEILLDRLGAEAWEFPEPIDGMDWEAMEGDAERMYPQPDAGNAAVWAAPVGDLPRERRRSTEYRDTVRLGSRRGP